MRIPLELFEFLSELKENNNRPWFQENKYRYEKFLKDPLLAFIAAFADRLPTISPYYMAVPKVTGGSLFRIYRDVRFSKDKQPYKTWAGMHFRHDRARDVHSPGYYLHLEHPQRWIAAKQEEKFASLYRLAGESLKRPPRGFDPDHPLIEDLKRKDFLASIEIDERTATRPDFLDYYVETCQIAVPFMRFLTESLSLSW